MSAPSVRLRLSAHLLCAAALLASPWAGADAPPDSNAEELAKIAQNPVGNIISVPIQENVNVNTGPMDATQNVLNIQPVIPIAVGDDWNIITRTILPIISQPGFAPGQDRTNGLGDTQVSAMFSPAKPGAWIWGAGFITQLPTHTNDVLGNRHAGLGPSFVMLHLEKGSPWVYGALINNVWSLGNSSDPKYNNTLFQPFVNYNLQSGFYYTTGPQVTVAWSAPGPQQWTLPVGGGVGKLFKIGRLPINAQVAAYYNAVRPEAASNFQFRLQVQMLFPK